MADAAVAASVEERVAMVVSAVALEAGVEMVATGGKAVSLADLAVLLVAVVRGPIVSDNLRNRCPWRTPSCSKRPWCSERAPRHRK